jgi:hypothetical protein
MDTRIAKDLAINERREALLHHVALIVGDEASSHSPTT